MDTPSLLVAFPSAPKLVASWPRLKIRSWVLDSGAFGVRQSGKVIDLNQYIDYCSLLLSGPMRPELVFNLDVIGDPEASARNHERMVDQGVPAVPTFHYGSHWSYLEAMAKRFDRVALGGLVLRGKGGHGTRLQIHRKSDFMSECFSRIWPKWVHGFGCLDRRLLGAFPLASADSVTWEYAPSKYGYSSLLGSQRVPRVRADPAVLKTFIRSEIACFLDLERFARGRFGRVLARHGFAPFTTRLSCGPQSFRWFEG